MRRNRAWDRVILESSRCSINRSVEVLLQKLTKSTDKGLNCAFARDCVGECVWLLNFLKVQIMQRWWPYEC